MPNSALTSPMPVPPPLGGRAGDHFLPFQCCAWVKNVNAVKVPSSPAAQQLLAEVQDRLNRPLASSAAGPARVGGGALDHFVPFQCSASLRNTIVPLRVP